MRYKGLLIVLVLLAVALLKVGAAGTGAVFCDIESSRGNVFSAGVWYPVTATIDFDPDTLNLKSEGSVVTVYIYLELPPGYDVSQVDISSIRLNGAIAALDKPTEIGDYDGDGITDLMVKFDRAAVQSVLAVGEQVQITITGEVDGIAFEGRDTIRVIDQ